MSTGTITRTGRMDREWASDRKVAKVVGGVFIAGMVIGIPGSLLIESILSAPDHLSTIASKSMLLSIGALLWLMTLVGDAAHGVLMFPILRRHNERLAVGYLASRIIDAVFIGAHLLFVLLQIPLGRAYLRAGASSESSLPVLSNVLEQAGAYSYEIAMTILGIAGLLLCYSFYRFKLVPRAIAIWGLVGYTTMLCGSMLGVLGFNLNSLHVIPGGLWELFIGVWLIAKGFSSPAIDPAANRIEAGRAVEPVTV